MWGQSYLRRKQSPIGCATELGFVDRFGSLMLGFEASKARRDPSTRPLRLQPQQLGRSGGRKQR